MEIIKYIRNMKKYKISPEVKEQIINRIKNEGISVAQAVKDHGVSDNTIYGWISKKVEGQPTLSELLKLRKENDELKRLVGDITLKLSETQKRNND
jgi:transposase-like protein